MQTPPFFGPEKTIDCKGLQTDLYACIVNATCSHASMNVLWDKWAECDKKVIGRRKVEIISDK